MTQNLFCLCFTFKGTDFSDALRYALIHNRHEFINVIFENVDINEYLTDEELRHLYNSMV